MKLSALLSIVGLMTITSVSAIVPKVDCTSRCVLVTGVEQLDTCTRLSVTLQNYPKYWVRIDDTAFLHAVGDTTVRYKVKGEENIPFGKKIKMPASGQHTGTLIFERVPDNVRIVDLVLDKVSEVSDNVLGIHLNEPDTTVYPDLLSAAKIFNSNDHPAEAWTGLDPARYRDMSFYKKDGVTHLRGRIVDYSPRSGVTTFTIRTKDDVTDTEKTNIGEINPDGTFALDIPVTYPQFDYFMMGDMGQDLFLIPGDTLSLVTSLKMHVAPGPQFVRDCFGFEGDPDDGIAINLLADSISAHYGLMDMRRNMRVEKSDSMQAQTYAACERAGARLDSVITDLPAFIGNLPISNFAKDILTVKVLGGILEVIEGFDMDFRYAKGPISKRDSLGNVEPIPGETLDLNRFILPLSKHIGVLYDNPLMLCNGWVLPNRWKFDTSFGPSGKAARGIVPNGSYFSYKYSEEGAKAVLLADIARLDSLGLGNCFVAQLVRTMALTDALAPERVDYAYISMPRINRLVTNQLKYSDYDVLDDALLSAYSGLIRKIAIAENQLADAEDVNIDTSSYDGLLEKIIAPYKGNILFLDFWGIGCGPCRAGMIQQKPLLEEYADKPFRALYIANADEGKAECEKWMAKEGIKGEHIFVWGDDWNRLQSLFNFSAIPFGAMVDKTGKVVNTKMHGFDRVYLDKLSSE